MSNRWAWHATCRAASRQLEASRTTVFGATAFPLNSKLLVSAIDHNNYWTNIQRHIVFRLSRNQKAQNVADITNTVSHTGLCEDADADSGKDAVQAT